MYAREFTVYWALFFGFFLVEEPVRFIDRCEPLSTKRWLPAHHLAAPHYVDVEALMDDGLIRRECKLYFLATSSLL